MKSVITRKEEETVNLGETIAADLQSGDTVAFYGGLGAGKTHLIKGICSYFEVPETTASPTFNIINTFYGQMDTEDILIYHIDLYRIKSRLELMETGFSELIYSEDSIKLIEWSENSFGLLPDNYLKIEIKQFELDENMREIVISRIA
jgi:tRNA threonylcarbamoyladenosine biosynthesis protein TsaE